MSEYTVTCPDCTENRRRADDWEREHELRLSELRRVAAECRHYRAALERIANQDFRGNRPYEQTIARAALNDGGNA